MPKDGVIFDLIIIGAGPAGISASIYASRYKLNHLILGVEQGGQMTEIYEIENYPGIFSVSGKELMGKFLEHLENFGMKVKNESVSSIEKNGEGLFEVKTSKKNYLAKAIILAMGAVYRKMNIPGEKEYIGKGVSYCATCDARFFKDKIVSVAGGGNSAAVVALEMADFAKKVYLICRDEKLSAEPAWLDKIYANEKIEVIKSVNILEIKGSEKVERIVLDKPVNPHTNDQYILPENKSANYFGVGVNDKTSLAVDGVFIEVGTEPGVELARKLKIEKDERNYIKVKADQSTNIPGVFAAGDITTGSNKFCQVLTACAEGAIAANSAYKMIKLKN